MYLKDKRVLVMGLGISGLSTIIALDKYKARLVLADQKDKVELKDILNSIKDIDLEMKLGGEEIDLNNIDLIVKSPGIPPMEKTLLRAKEMGIEIINDIELGYRLANSKNIIAITGTNGKTTTTTLIGEILKKANYNPHIAGNIGVGFLKEVINSKKEDFFVLELSSFQLEHTSIFKPRIALMLNISPDHLDWHGNYENYINSKKKIFKNQDNEDALILNYDDPILRGFEDEINANIIWFSVNTSLNRGVYLKGQEIVYNNGVEEKKIINCRELRVIGKHNLENILGAIGVSVVLNIDIKIIRDSLKDFRAVEHRLEFVEEINGVRFFNDSKGTNPNASIKAIEAIDGSIVLIAGGYEKNSEFHEFIDSFKGKVKYLILLGSTKDKIRDIALKHDYKDIKLVNTMEDAVNLAYSLSKPGDTILLSPACASWDMYKNFEERGNDFKRLVYNLGDGHSE